MAADHTSTPAVADRPALWRHPHTDAAGGATISGSGFDDDEQPYGGLRQMRNEIDNGADRRPRRFSEGQEHIPSLPSSARVGRFSDGMARSLAGAGGGARI